MTHELHSRVALVTGAASGIGAATATVLADAGAVVWAADLDDDKLATNFGGRDNVRTCRLDVRDEVSVQRCVRDAVDRDSQIGILVNVAGTGSTQNAIDTTLADWERVFSVNARGTFLCCKHVLPSMIECGHGVIVNIASIAGMVGLRNRAAYCASKGSVIALTRALAIDHVRQGVRVNCVCPGTIDSPWVRRLVDEAGESLEELCRRQPMGRLGTPDEVAQAVLFLASDAAEFWTGSSLVMDGGLTAA